MKPIHLLCSALLFAASLSLAEVPAAQGLLPDDTLFVVTVPSAAKARTAYAQSAEVQLWNDPAMRPFREKFMAKWKSDLMEPLEKELNIKFADYEELAQGQFTLAAVRNGWTGGTNPEPALVILLDSGSKSEQMAKNLTDLRKKWTDGGKQVRTEKIRDTDFSVLALAGDELSAPFKKIFGSGAEEEDEDPDADKDAKAKKAKKEDLFIGQNGSVLVIGDNTKVLEKVLARLAGSQVPTLAEQPNFETANTRLFRDAILWGWVDVKTFIDITVAEAAKEAADDEGPTFFPTMNKVIPALGLDSLKTVALSIRADGEGSLVQFFVGAPATERAGLMKMLAVEEKDATPPPFVPSDAVDFQRIRLDLPKTWSELEAMVGKLIPSYSTVLETLLGQVGKDKDPNFDLKKSLLASLGDDFISYTKAPKSSAAADLQNPPNLMLLGSPKADQLVVAFKAITSMLPAEYGGGSEVKERELLGRKIYSLASPKPEGAEGPNVALHFTATGGYVAISTDPGMVEEYIRNTETPGKPLRDRSGLLEAAQKAGGPSSGLFGFSDQAEHMRVAIETLRKSADKGGSLSSFSLNLLNPGAGEDLTKGWFDYALLPEFSQIAKYFGITVQTGGANADGLSLKYFSPQPPALNK